MKPFQVLFREKLSGGFQPKKMVHVKRRPKITGRAPLLLHFILIFQVDKAQAQKMKFMKTHTCSQRDSGKALNHTNSLQVPNPIIPNTEIPLNVIMENSPAVFEKE